MVYADAAKKTGSLVILSLGLGLGIVAFLSGDIGEPTGFVAKELVSPSGVAWALFVVGLIAGCLILGAYSFIKQEFHNNE